MFFVKIEGFLDGIVVDLDHFSQEIVDNANVSIEGVTDLIGCGG